MVVAQQVCFPAENRILFKLQRYKIQDTSHDFAENFFGPNELRTKHHALFVFGV